MPDAYVGLGSNLEPGTRLRAAVEALRTRFGRVRCSAVYRSRATGAAAPDYWNLAATFAASGGVARLVDLARELERAAGRVRPSPHVSLDVDVLLYGARVDPLQRVPRADVLRRTFVLGPLAELAPALVHPVTGDRLADAWRTLGDAEPRLERLGMLEELASS